MRTLFLLLTLVPTLALAEGGPTKGQVPVPENHTLVHEFMGARGLYTEIFANVFVKDKFVGANVVIRTNDGVSGKDASSLFSLASTTPCEGESGLIRNYVANKAPSEHHWKRIVPRDWRDNDSRRRYAPSDDINDLLATEMCLQTHPYFKGSLYSAWNEETQKIIEEGTARQEIVNKAKEKCDATLAENRSSRQQLDAADANLEKRDMANEEYRSSLGFRRQLLEAAPRNRHTANLSNSLAAQWNADQADFNRRVEALKADSVALEKRRGRHNALVAAYNDECVK